MLAASCGPSAATAIAWIATRRKVRLRVVQDGAQEGVPTCERELRIAGGSRRQSPHHERDSYRHCMDDSAV